MKNILLAALICCGLVAHVPVHGGVWDNFTEVVNPKNIITGGLAMFTELVNPKNIITGGLAMFAAYIIFMPEEASGTKEA